MAKRWMSSARDALGVVEADRLNCNVRTCSIPCGLLNGSKRQSGLEGARRAASSSQLVQPRGAATEVQYVLEYVQRRMRMQRHKVLLLADTIEVL